MSRCVAIIPARGGSKGIPRKNLVDFCGKPLVAWSILQARAAAGIESVWVSSDSDEILAVAAQYGARGVRRPAEIAGDRASSEAAWLHALDAIEAEGPVGLVAALQATSPIREARDLELALATFEAEGLDSLLSVTEIEDFFIWRRGEDGRPESVTYDWRNRRPRQLIEKRYLENGSFYLFRPAILRETGNRLGGRIGFALLEKHKLFQIDNPDDLQLAAAVFRGYGLDR